MTKKIAVLTSGLIGYEMLQHLNKIKKKVFLIIVDNKDSKSLIKKIKRLKISDKIYYADKRFDTKLVRLIEDNDIELFLSFWWPHIIKEKYIKLSRYGVLNPHTGYLPYERGVHSYVYSILRNHPKGVTLHFMEKDVDCGFIYKQKKLRTKNFITGKELEKLATNELINFYKKNLNNLINLKFNKTKLKRVSNKSIQNFRKNLDKNTKINLNKQYKAFNFINLLLSRSGFKKGGAHFTYDNKNYEININVREKK